MYRTSTPSHPLNSFGSIMEGRSYEGDTNLRYRFGFNGKENTNEIYGEGNGVDFGSRIYDGRLGRFLSIDPLQMDYPYLSSYNYCANDPINNVDIAGQWIKKKVTRYYQEGSDLKVKKWYNIFKQTVKVDIQITVHNAKFYNATEIPLVDGESEAIREYIKSDIQNQVSQKALHDEKAKEGKQNIEYNVTTTFEGEIKEVKDLGKVEKRGFKRDNLYVILTKAQMDNITASSGKKAAGYAPHPELMFLTYQPIEKQEAMEVIKTYVLEQFGSTPAHETAHQLYYGHDKEITSISYENSVPVNIESKQKLTVGHAKFFSGDSLKSGTANSGPTPEPGGYGGILRQTLRKRK